MEKPMQVAQLLYSRRGTARTLDCSLRTVDSLIALGELKTIRVGRRRMIPHTALEAFIRRDHQTQPDCNGEKQ